MHSPDTFSIPSGALAKAGLSIDLLCKRAGVPLSKAWGTSDFFRLWAAADEAICDRAAGLRFGTQGIAEGHGIASIVALHAPDFRHALATLSRYKRLTCPELVEIDVASKEVAVRYRWLQATGEVPRLLVDTTMASLKEMARQGSGGKVAPMRLELARRPANQALLLNHYQCPIVFGAAHDAMIFDRSALDVQFVTARCGAFEKLVEGLEKKLAEGHGFSELMGEVRVAIARLLSEGGQPSVVAVAGRLLMSSRTLQRRLRESHTSFQQQLMLVRRITASRLLADTELDTVAISMLLGYVEPNSFARAFRAWELTSPSRWRVRRASAGL